MENNLRIDREIGVLKLCDKLKGQPLSLLFHASKQLFGEQGFILKHRNRFTCFFSMCGQSKPPRLDNLRIFFALAALLFLEVVAWFSACYIALCLSNNWKKKMNTPQNEWKCLWFPVRFLSKRYQRMPFSYLIHRTIIQKIRNFRKPHSNFASVAALPNPFCYRPN